MKTSNTQSGFAVFATLVVIATMAMTSTFLAGQANPDAKNILHTVAEPAPSAGQVYGVDIRN